MMEGFQKDRQKQMIILMSKETKVLIRIDAPALFRKNYKNALKDFRTCSNNK